MGHIWISQVGDYHEICEDYAQYERGGRKTRS